MVFDCVSSGFQGNSKLALVALSSLSRRASGHQPQCPFCVCVSSETDSAVRGSTRKEVICLWRKGILCRSLFHLPVFQHACAFPGHQPISLRVGFSSCGQGHQHNMVLSGYPWSMTGSLLVKLVITYTIGGLEITSEKSDRLSQRESVLKIA